MGQNVGQTPDQAGPVVTLLLLLVVMNENSSVVYGAVTVRNLHNDPMACGQLPSIAELRQGISANWASVTWLARGGSRRAPSLAQALPTYSALGAPSKGCGFVLSVNGSW